jgi:hypothetical protein
VAPLRTSIIPGFVFGTEDSFSRSIAQVLFDQVKGSGGNIEQVTRANQFIKRQWPFPFVIHVKINGPPHRP